MTVGISSLLIVSSVQTEIFVCYLPVCLNCLSEESLLCVVLINQDFPSAVAPVCTVESVITCPWTGEFHTRPKRPLYLSIMLRYSRIRYI
jgi:hypothetical protein